MLKDLYFHVVNISFSTLEVTGLLECIGVSKQFGGLKALKSVNFVVKENEITGLVGPNGSGKSTLLNVISGVYKPDAGKVTFLNEDISKLPPNVQERLLRLQQQQQTLRSILTQKQQLELELTEVDQALSEIEKLTDDTIIYKSIGSLLVKSERPKVTSELNERKDLLNMRIKVLGKQEERLRTQIKDLQTKLQQDLRPL